MKRQANVLSALIQNFDTAERAIEASAKSSGSALRENEVYLDSIQGKMDQLTNATQTLWNNTLNSDAIKFLVNIGTQLVKLIDQFGLIKTLVFGIGTYLIQKHWKGDLMGGLFGGDIEDAKNKLKLVEDKLAKLQGKKSTPLNQKRINKLQGIKTETEQYIKEYDELSEKLKKYRAESEGAKKSLDDFNKKLANKAAKGKKITDNDIKQQSNLNAKYDESNKKVKQTEAELAKVEMQANATGTAGLTAGQKIKAGFSSAAKSVVQFGKQMLKSMAWSMAFTAVFEAIGNVGNLLKKAWDAINPVTTLEELEDALSETKNQLSSVESEINSLNAELDDTNERIEELLNQGSLSFVEQEELSKLQSATAELEAQIKLQETLRQSLQSTANNQTVAAMNSYLDTSFMSEKTKSERQEEAKETGEQVGQAAGTVLGVAGAAIVGYFTGGTGFGIGYAIGMGIGSVVGKLLGGFIGEGIAGATYDFEQSVGEAMDDMMEERERLKKAQATALASGDATAYNEATEALATYDKQLTTHIQKIQEAYNTMDWESASPEERQKMIEYADWLDKYNISMGTVGAKSNAIARIFGDEASDELKEIKSSIESALEAGESVDFMDFEDEKYDAFKERLYGLGLTVTDVVAYFEALKVAQDAASEYDTFDTVKEIAKYEDGISGLKDAFDEFNESGAVTAATLIKLNEVFGNVEGWQKYVDVMSTGTASTEEAMKVTNDLAEALMDNILSNPFDFTNDDGTKNLDAFTSYLTAIQQLRSIGVTNAKELVDAKQQEAMINEVVTNIKRVQELESKTTLTDAEQAELTKLKKNNYEEYAQVVEDAYGVEIKNTDLIRQQLELTTTQTQLKKYQDFDNEHFTDANLDWTKYKDNAEEIGKLQKVVDDYNQTINEYENQGNWEKFKDEVVGFFGSWFPDDDSDRKHYNDAKNNIGTYQNQIDTYKQNSKEAFDELVAFAKENNISLEGIDLDQFDATDISENSVFKQVYDVVSKYVGEKQVELEKLEAEIIAQLNTAFDQIGLEVILELQDKDKLVDDIQSIYDELSNAQKEYAENGYISVDTMQSLLKLEPKYLDLLVDENGNLNLTKEKLHEVARARIIDLGLKQQSAIADQALALAQNGSREALDEWIIVNEQADESMKDSISTTKQLILSALLAKEATGDLPEGYANNFMTILENQLSAVQRVTDIALSDLDNTLSTSGNTSRAEVEDAFQKLMDYYDNRISANQAKYDQIQNDIDWLENQGKMADASYYKDQIALITEGEESKTALLNNKLAQAAVRMRELEAAGQEGSDEWFIINKPAY